MIFFSSLVKKSHINIWKKRQFGEVNATLWIYGILGWKRNIYAFFLMSANLLQSLHNLAIVQFKKRMLPHKWKVVVDKF